jgi:16S rRNA (cytosine1402-N4)-methyltransferase
MSTEAVSFLQPQRGGLFVDCTVGAGGHTEALLMAGADRVIAFDRDTDALKVSEETLKPWGKRVDLVHADFRTLDTVLDDYGVNAIDGAVADLGVSSIQLDGEGRGFSFRRNDPLDMRMDRSSGATAAEMLATIDEAGLADVIYRYGEERNARRIARSLVASREHSLLDSTTQLAEVVRKATARRGHRRIHPATRTFQAIRIWVNRELEELEAWLLTVCRRLRAGARFAVLTFHSLEDRIVKHTFRGLSRNEDPAIKILTKRPMRPSPDEVQRNPRSRSAKLRVAERVA